MYYLEAYLLVHSCNLNLIFLKKILSIVCIIYIFVGDIKDSRDYHILIILVKPKSDQLTYLIKFN